MMQHLVVGVCEFGSGRFLLWRVDGLSAGPLLGLVTPGRRGEGGVEVGLEGNEEVVFVHGLELVGGSNGDESGGEFHV